MVAGADLGKNRPRPETRGDEDVDITRSDLHLVLRPAEGNSTQRGHRAADKTGRTQAPRPQEDPGAKIVGMVSIDERPAEVAGPQVPGHFEGDLIIGKGGKSAMGTLVERVSRFLIPVALPGTHDADSVCDAVFEAVKDLPAHLRRSLTWDQGTEMARHAALSLKADMPVYFAHAHSPWERGTNENTNGLIREYLPKGTEIPGDLQYLWAIADELNDRPRATLGFRTPREVFTELLLQEVEPITSAIPSTD